MATDTRGTRASLRLWINSHRMVSAVGALILVVLVYGGFRTFTGGTVGTRYVLAAVERGTVVVSVTGSGQVSASNQIDLKPTVSGTVLYLGAASGDTVAAGTLIAKLDTTDAEKAVRDAQVNLDSAKLALQKLQEPADALSLIQTENSLAQANDDEQKSYDDGYNTVSSTFLDLPNVLTSLQDVLYGTELTKGNQSNASAYANMVQNYDSTAIVFENSALTAYQSALTAYNQNLLDYKASNRLSGATSTQTLIDETYATAKSVADAVKSANDFLNFINDRLTFLNYTIPSLLGTHEAALATNTAKMNTDVQNLSNAKNTIVTSVRTVAAQTESLAKLKAGADPLDIAAQNLGVKQKQNALADAQATLDDYYIRAPFDGTIAKVAVQKFDAVSSGTVMATVITSKKFATISLNEIDAAKIKVGEKATLTFDAISDLNLTGAVTEVDSVGTVSQGVVTYSVQIGFDTQDSRIKTGMSVNAAIITDVRQNVLVVPNSAVKTQGGTTYVQALATKQPAGALGVSGGITSAVPPQTLPVQTGLSNDTVTEIAGGLNEGDPIIVRTITTGAAPATQSAPSLFGGGTGGRGGIRGIGG